MTETRCTSLCGNCSFFVTTAVGMMMVAVGTVSPAFAKVEDTFAQFEARCLTPMLEVRDSDTLGLTLMAADPDREMWMADFRDWQLERSTPAAVLQFCAIHGAFGPEVDAWAQAALASGDWITIDITPETLQSTTIREPRIEVEIDRSATPMSLTVIETELES